MPASKAPKYRDLSPETKDVVKNALRYFGTGKGEDKKEARRKLYEHLVESRPDITTEAEAAKFIRGLVPGKQFRQREIASRIALFAPPMPAVAAPLTVTFPPRAVDGWVATAVDTCGADYSYSPGGSTVTFQPAELREFWGYCRKALAERAEYGLSQADVDGLVAAMKLVDAAANP
jgi:hypothetical protein